MALLFATLLLPFAAHAQLAAALPANRLPLVVKGLQIGGAHAYNRMVVTITVCVPGGGRCVQVDDVMVDTGSVGLRLQARAVMGLNLPVERSDNREVAECFRFVGKNNIWGMVHHADVHLGGLIAPDLPVHVANPDLMRPADGSCPNYDNLASSNGTLGIGRAAVEHSGTLYGCTEGACRPFSAAAAKGLGLPNPVAALPRDNNGEIFVIPAAGQRVVSSISGSLIFGVDTESDNRLSADTQILPLDADGLFKTKFDGRTYTTSYIDSGTPSIIFYDHPLPTCQYAPANYCADATSKSFSATLVSGDGSKTIANPFRMMAQPGIPGRLYDVYDDIVSRGDDRDVFVWGLPFFLGKQVALVQQNQSPPDSGLTGPFYAIAPFP